MRRCRRSTARCSRSRNETASGLLKLVNTLLDFARIEAGRDAGVLSADRPCALTADLASNFRSACERAGIRLVVDCPPLARAGLRRSRDVGKDRPQSALERLQVHPRRGRFRCVCAMRATRRARRQRHRHRHPRRRAAAHVRALPSRGERARPQPRGQRHRPRARPGARQAARRIDRRGEPARQGHDVQGHDSEGQRHLPAGRVTDARERPRPDGDACRMPTSPKRWAGCPAETSAAAGSRQHARTAFSSPTTTRTCANTCDACSPSTTTSGGRATAGPRSRRRVAPARSDHLRRDDAAPRRVRLDSRGARRSGSFAARR